MNALHLWELSIIRDIQQIRSEPLDAFFKFLNFFDERQFYFFLVILVWVGLYWKWGVKFFYLMLLSGIVNSSLKKWFMLPRPDQLDPSLGLFHFSSYGMPSGAAQASIVIATFFLTVCKNKKLAWPLAIIYPLLMGFSRVYLGVHFISDVIGGYLVGLSLALIYIYFVGPIEKWIKKLTQTQVLLIIFLTSACFMFLPGKIAFTYGAGAFGIGVGLYFSLKKNIFLPLVKNFKEFLIRSIIGLSGSVLLVMALTNLTKDSQTKFLVLFILGLWVSLLCPITQRFFLRMLKR